MCLRIAIQPDEMTHPTGQRQSFSERWFELARMQNIKAVPVNVLSRDIIAQVASCDAFMWRYPSSARTRNYGKRLMHAIEAGLGIPVFPTVKISSYYEDKPAQRYFFEAAGIPSITTNVFWSRQDAEWFCENTHYPFVLKLAGGHQSLNVRLVHNLGEARFYIDEMFSHGVISLGYRPASSTRLLLRRLRLAADVVRGHNPHGSMTEAELQYGYFYAQEFLPDNEFDTSVIIIGDRAFAVRRFNHPGDFRTRGSTGRMDWDPQAIAEDAIRLAYQTARKLDARTIAVDIMRRGDIPVIVELSVNYSSWVVQECPGHWILDGDPQSGELAWTNGYMRAEDAIFEDFVGELRRSIRITDPADLQRSTTHHDQGKRA